MGILDNLDFDKLAANPLLQVGLGILANNRGNYGAFAPAFGGGVQQGLAQVGQFQRQQQEEAMRKQQMDMQKQQFDQSQKSYADTQSAIAEATRLHPELAGAFRIDPKAAIKAAYPALSNTEFGMSPRVGINPSTGKPEYVSFGNNGSIKFTGVVPTQDEIKQAELIDKGVSLPNYGPTPQAPANSARRSVLDS